MKPVTPYLKVIKIQFVSDFIEGADTNLKVGVLLADGKPITPVAFDEIDISSEGKPMVCHKGTPLMIVDEVVLGVLN